MAELKRSPEEMSASESNTRKPTIWSWWFQIPLALVCFVGFAHSRFVEERNEDWILAIGIPALIAGCYDLYLRRSLKKESIQPPETTRGK